MYILVVMVYNGCMTTNDGTWRRLEQYEDGAIEWGMSVNEDGELAKITALMDRLNSMVEHRTRLYEEDWAAIQTAAELLRELTQDSDPDDEALIMWCTACHTPMYGGVKHEHTL